jgi:hypothetical protein
MVKKGSKNHADGLAKKTEDTNSATQVGSDVISYTEAQA